VIHGDETSKLGIVYALAERPSVQLHKDHKTKQKIKERKFGLTPSVDQYAFPQGCFGRNGGDKGI
jgi:hypothetical protein